MSAIIEILKEPTKFLSRLYSSKTQKSLLPPQTSNVFNSILSPIEAYVVSLQSLLIWERPYLSAAAFVTLNIFYWLIVSWNRRFISIVSVFAIAFYLYKTWVKQIWPEIRVPSSEGEDSESWTTVNPEVLSVPELSQYLNDFLEKMIILWKDVWKLRKDNHGLFCALMCGFFSILALIGRLFPGVLIVYFIVLLLTLGPGVALHLIPQTLYDQMMGYFADTDSQVNIAASTKTSNSDKDSDIEEFLPEVSAEILRQLSLKDEVPEIPSPGRVLTETLNQDYPSAMIEDLSLNGSDEYSLYQGLGAFPSVEEEGESDIEEENSEKISHPPTVTESKEKAPDSTEMHFNPTHFKEDSSESESDVFTEGLSFEKPLQQVASTSLAAQNPQQSGEQKLSSSDLEDELMDFEILEESDIHA